jgi:hypothetical protein
MCRQLLLLIQVLKAWREVIRCLQQGQTIVRPPACCTCGNTMDANGSTHVFTACVNSKLGLGRLEPFTSTADSCNNARGVPAGRHMQQCTQQRSQQPLYLAPQVRLRLPQVLGCPLAMVALAAIS